MLRLPPEYCLQLTQQHPVTGGVGCNGFRGTFEGLMTMKFTRSSLAIAALIMMSGAALAEAGKAVPWQMNLQDPVTPVAEYITWFSNLLTWA